MTLLSLFVSRNKIKRFKKSPASPRDVGLKIHCTGDEVCCDETIHPTTLSIVCGNVPYTDSY